jgi:glutathione synthase/RimK-type ligase-like ATP-grasp enzyme
VPPTASSRRVAIATCRELPEPDVDEELLMVALAHAGIDATLAAWDDEAVCWDEYGLCVIRSTWNYPEFPSDFLNWIEAAGSAVPMLNPPDVVRSNVDKRYLLDLERKGIPIVPTEFFRRGERPNLAHWVNRPFVVKPTISAGSWITRRFYPDEIALGIAFLQKHLEDRDMMVQPYLDSVERGGEVAWIWIDGKVTHGVRKSPRFEEDEESVSEAVAPTERAREMVCSVLDTLDADLLYARIDLMESKGNDFVSEVELIEPSLFFKQNPAALDRFVSAVKGRIA